MKWINGLGGWIEMLCCGNVFALDDSLLPGVGGGVVEGQLPDGIFDRGLFRWGDKWNSRVSGVQDDGARRRFKIRLSTSFGFYGLCCSGDCCSSVAFKFLKTEL